MRKFYLLLLFVIVSFIGRAQVSVTATAGTTGPTPYTTLKDAFDAVNAGTHQGGILISLTGNTTETGAPCVLNSSGAGSASYTSLIIRPDGDNITVSGATATGRGLIELNGADNVTIEGDNANTGGINRNLTFTNTAAATITYTSVIRLATGTGVASTDNVIIQNCTLNGSATGRNVAGTTSTTGSENTTFGIYCGGNGGSTATTAPTALTSVTTNSAAAGTTMNSFTAANNAVTACARAIVFNGAASSVSNTVFITANTIGTAGTQSGAPPYTSPATTVYSKGIWLNGLTAATVTSNTLQNILSYVGTTLTAIETVGAIGTGSLIITGNTINTVVNNGTSVANGIQFASATGTYSIVANTISSIQAAGSSCSAITLNTTATSGIISGNNITTVRSRSTGGVRAGGIVIAGGSSVTIQNNFIAEVLNIGSASFSTTFNASGILLLAGSNHKVYHNTVNLFGVSTSTGSNSINCLAITSSSQTGIDVRNNIFSNTVTGGAATDAHTCVFLPYAANASMSLTLNNNAYYTGSVTASCLGFGGATSYNAANKYTVANFVAATTTPSTNWRSFSSAMGNTSNDNGSLGFTSAAPFVSATDLHINTGVTPTQLESYGASVGVTFDIDGQARPGPAGSVNGGATAPDLGADEFDAVPLDLSSPSITYTPLSFTCNTADRILSNVTIADGSSVPTSGGNVPRVYYRKNAGTWYSQAGSLNSGNGFNGTWTFVIVAADMGGLAGGDVVQYYVIAQDQATTPNIGSSPSGVTATNVNTVSVHPASPNSFAISSALSGTYNVGAAQTYTTLTAAIAAYNTSCLTGPVVFQLMDASYAEAGAMTISTNPDASAVNTLTIRPASGVTAGVTASAASAALLKIQASYVTIDGSNNGTNSRNLTFTNSSTTSPTVLAITSSGTTPVVFSTIKNCTVINGVNTSTAMMVSDGTTLGSPGYFNNITIRNNDIQKAYMGVYCNAAVSAGNGNNLLLDSNSLVTSGANAIRFTGLYLQGTDGAIVRNNNIGNFDGVTSEMDAGIWAATGNTNTVIERNNIHDLNYTGTSGYGTRGIAASSGTANANISIRNNMIRNISGDADGFGTFGATFSPAGIYIFGAGQSGVQIHYNTIYLSGNTITDADGYSFGVAVDDGSSANLKNNIIHNNLGRVASSGIGAVAIGAELTASQIASSNYNDFYMASTGGGGNFFGKIGATNYTTLAAWQAAISGDANSVNILPVYVSGTDLHLNPASNTSLNGLGNPISGITTDYDNNTRDVATPDMGADEFAPPPCTAVAGATVATPTGPFCAPGATVLSLSGAGIGTGTSYQWQTSPNGVSWTDSAGQTSATMTVTGLMASRWYQCMVGCTATGTFSSSTPVQIVVTAGPTAVATPGGPIYLCTPSTQLLSVATNAATPSYQWKAGGVNIGGATTSSYTVTASGTYTVTVTDAATTCSTTSNGVVVGIEAPPTAPVITPSTTTMCEGAAPVQISITSGGVTTGTLTFGTQANQNAASTTATGYPAPYSVFYGGQRMQMLIRASELSAAGLTAGPINTLYFPVVSLGSNWGGSLTSCQSFQVSMRLSDSTSISTFQTGLTQVVAPANFTPAVGYSNTHTLSTPFSWDGTSNLVIETTFGNGITGGANDVVVQYNSPTSFRSCVVYRVDGAGPASPATVAASTTVSFGYTARPDFKINGAVIGNFTWAPTTGLYTDALGTIPYTGLAASTVYAQPAAGTTVYTATSCSTSGTATVDVTSPTSLAAVAGGPQRCNTSTVSPAGTKFYFGGACGLIAKIVPSGSPAVSGSVDACVKIDASVQTDPYNVPYVTRHYDITPATGAATAQAQITLYFLQSEFDDFNTYVTTNALPFPPLPTGGVDNGNIKITQFHGTGTVPGNYTGAPELIVPAGVVWNAVKGWWEITFPVAGFSGFYLHSGSKSLLPVPFNALRLSAALTGETNTVYWTTETEENNKKFIIERSADGRNFSAVGELNSRAPGGNSHAPITYSFVDQRPINGKQYYRLRLISLTGGEQLTQIVSLRRGSPGIEFASVRPNPTSGMVYLNINGTNNEVTMVVRNMEGKEVLRSVKQPNQEFTINISSQPSGVYVLEATDTKTGLKALFKLVKQ